MRNSVYPSACSVTNNIRPLPLFLCHHWMMRTCIYHRRYMAASQLQRCIRRFNVHFYRGCRLFFSVCFCAKNGRNWAQWNRSVSRTRTLTRTYTHQRLDFDSNFKPEIPLWNTVKMQRVCASDLFTPFIVRKMKGTRCTHDDGVCDGR